MSILKGKGLLLKNILQSLDEALKDRQDFEQLIKICFEVDENTDQIMQIMEKFIQKHGENFNAAPFLENIIDEMLEPKNLDRLKDLIDSPLHLRNILEKYLYKLKTFSKQKVIQALCDKLWDLNQKFKWFDFPQLRYTHLTQVVEF